MKSLRLPLALFLGLSVPLLAQQPEAPVPADSAAVAGPVQRTPQELDQLLAPIALYPDALIAIILPATTAPTDIVLAARYVRDNPGDRSQVEHRAWDESVKSLTSYPEVLLWLDDNLPWTQQVGEAFARQAADVMQAVQRLRAKAQAAGTLTDSPQQQIITEAQVIRIVPAQPDIIYVPHYEPDVVFVDRPVFYSRPFLTFGIGVPVGSWLAFDCDWRRHTIWVGNRHRPWVAHDWRRPVVPLAPSYRATPITSVHAWRPPPPALRPSFAASNRFRSEIARPAPINVTTARTYTPRGPAFADRDRGDRYDRTDRYDRSDRRRETSPSSAVPPVPAPASSGFRRDFAGPRSPDTVVPAPARVTPPSAPGTPAPNLQPLPQTRRNERTDRGDRNDRNERGDRTIPGDNDGNRGRGFRANPSPAPAPAASIAPSMPAFTPAPRSAPISPTPSRSYSRSAPPPPATVSPAPAPAPSAPPQTANPSSTSNSSSGETRGNRGGGNSGGERRRDGNWNGR